MHLVAGSVVSATAHLLRANRSRLKTLEIRMPHPRHYQERPRNYEMPENIRWGLWEGDQLLPIIKPLLGDSNDTGPLLHLYDLEIRHIERLKMSTLARAIDLSHLRRLCIVDTNVHFMEDGSEVWKTLASVGPSLSLKALITDVERYEQFEEFVDFLASFDGLVDVMLCDVDKRFSPDCAALLTGMARHFSSLERIFLPRNVHGFHYMDAVDMRKIVEGCPRLRELGWGMRREHQVSQPLLCLHK
jgi:hypothetical protein